MRVVSWLLGLALGLIAGGAMLAAGVLALLLLAPAALWAAREKGRPLGAAGLVIGLGGGLAGLLVLANARCDASNASGPNYFSGCVAPDITPYLLVAVVLVAVGTGVSLLGLVRLRRSGA